MFRHVLLPYSAICLIGVLDYLTGQQMGFSVFYAIPVFIATDGAGLRAGIGAADLGTVLWIAVMGGGDGGPSSILLLCWNGCMRLSMLLAIVALARARFAANVHRRDSRSDDLTGALNRRGLLELLDAEFKRARRFGRSVTVAYLDLDDFKRVNDSLGHQAGDQALCAVVQEIRRVAREQDLVGRLGGDEFAMCFAEADEREARTALERVQVNLNRRVQREGWPLTFSIGAVVFPTAPDDVQVALKQADALMYEAKRAGKARLLLRRRGA